MAYQILSNNIITQNGIKYQLKYDPSNGYAQIIQENSAAGTQPIFYNGSFTSSSPLSSAERASIYPDVQSFVRSAYNSAGGSSKGLKLPKWAQVQNQGNAPGVNNTSLSAPVYGNSTYTIPQGAAAGQTGTAGQSSAAGGAISNAAKTALNGNLWSAITSANELIKGLSSQGNAFGYVGENFGSITYPSDLRINLQDHLTISQYRYRAPNQESLFGKNNFVNIGLNGLGRNSDFSGGTETLLGIVHLPMPNNVSDSNNVDWGGNSFNNMAGALTALTQDPAQAIALAGASAIPGVGAGGAIAYLLAKATTDGAIGQELAASIGVYLQSQAIKRAGVQVNPETILARGAGIVPNNNMELLFNGPTLRQFAFQYRMTARDEPEAASIRKLIRSFKQGMAPKKLTGKSGAPSYFLGSPNIFRLTYETVNSAPILGVNRFKTCALQNFSCNYTPDGFWAAYDQGQPISVIMSMTFSELEPIYDTDYQENNFFTGRSDLSVSADSVGY